MDRGPTSDPYKRLFETMIDGAMLVDMTTGLVAMANQAAATIFHFDSPEEMIGQEMVSYIPVEDRDKVALQIADAVDKDAHLIVDMRAITRDKGQIWIRAQGVKAEYEGRPAVLASMRDVTSEKLAEAALMHAEHQYQGLFDNIQDGVAVLDVASGRIALANRATAKIFGFASPEEMVGLNPLDYVHEEDRERVIQLNAEILETEPKKPAEIKIRAKDGRLMWISATASLIEHEGRKATLTTIRDITANRTIDASLREAERQYQSLFDSMLDGAIVLDATTGRIALANKAAATIFGFPSPEDLVGLNPLDYVPQEEQEHVVQMMAKAFEGDRQAPAEMRILTRDKRQVWVSASGTLIEYEGRKATFTTIRDITSERARDAALRDAERRYEHLFDGMMDGAVVLDISTFQIVLANKAAADMFGFASPREIVGENPLSYIPEDDRDEVARQIALNLQGEGKNPAEIRVITRDKRNLWVSATASTIDYEGRTATLTTLRDITADKAKDAALKAAEEGKLQLIDAAAESIFVVQDWKMVYVNPAGAAVAGLSQKDMIGLSFRDFVHPDQKQVMTERYEKLLAGQWFSDFTTVKGIDAKGETRWAEIREIPYSWQGRPAVMSLVHDITDRMRADEERKEREERFRSIIENAWDAITILDENYNVIFESPSLARISGYTPEEWMGRPVGQMNIHPDDLVWLATQMETLKSQPGSVITDVKIRYQHKDGSWRWIEATGRNLLHDPKVKGLVVNFRDITERKRTEDEGKRLSTAIEQAADIVVVTDREGVMQYVNPAFTRATGYASDEAIGQNPRVLKSGRHDQAFYRDLWDTITAGKTWTGHFVNKKKDGSLYNEEATISPIRNSSGEITNFVAVKHDVTERLRTAEALESSEQRFRALIENATDAVAIVGPNGEILYESPAARRIAGYTTEEMVGHYVTEYIAPEDLGKVADLFVDLKSHPGKAVPPFQVRFRHADGSLHTAEMTIQNLVHVPGIGGAVVNYRDITARLKMEEALKHSEERFRTLIEKAADVVIVLDATGKVTYQSPSLERVTGFGHDEWLGRPLDQLLIHPDDMLSLATLLERVLNQPGATFEGVTARYQHKDGSWHTLEATVTNMLHDPNVAGIVANFRDITDRKAAQQALTQSEQKYRLLVENSTDVIFSLDTQGNFTYVSQAIERISGYRVDEVIGTSFVRFVMPEDLPALMASFERTLAGATEPSEFRAIVKDGSIRYARTTSKVTMRDGQVTGLTGIMSDITNSKLAEQSIRESEEKFRNLAEHSPNMIFINIKGRVVYANRLCHEMMGFTQEEFLSPDFDFLALTAPEYREIVKEKFRTHMSGQDVPPYEYAIMTKDGRRLDTILSTKLISYGGEKAILGTVTDITARKEMERALETEKAFTDQALDTQMDTVFVFDPTSGKAIRWNRSFCNISGYSDGEIAALPAPISYYGPDDLERTRAVQLRLAQGETVSIVMDLICKDGHKVTTEYTAAPMKDEKGDNRYVIAVGRDITQRKKAEEALRASEERNRLLIDNAAEVVTVVQDGLIVFINRKVTELAGYSPEELVSKSFIELIHPDDRQMVADNYVKRLSGEEAPTGYAFRVVHKNGLTKWAAASVTSFTWEGKPATLGLLTDITERKESEEALQEAKDYAENVIQTANVLFVALDRDGNVTQLNKAGEKITGYQQGEVLGKNWFELIVPKERYPKVWEAFEKVKASGTIVDTFDNPILTKSGEERIISWKNSTLVLNNEVIGTLSFGTDTTERKRAERTLRESEEKFRLLTEKTNDLIWMTDINLVTIYASPSAERLLGFSPEELLRLGPESLMTPESFGRAQEILLKQLELEREAGADPQRTVTLELEYRRKDGPNVWLENRISGIRDGDGGLIGLHGVARDVSERRKAEQALRASEEKYRLVADSTNDEIWTSDINLHTTYVSPSVERLLGFTVEERMKQDVMAQMTPESFAKAAEALTYHLALEEDPKADPNRILRIELEYYRKDGSTVWLENQISGIRDASGKLVGFHGVARDVSERKRIQEALQESEERFRTLIEKSTDAIAILDASGNLLYESPSMERITGYKLEDWLGKPVGDWLLHPDDLAAMASLLEKVLTQPDAISEEVSVRFKHKDGTWHFLEGTLRNLLADPKVKGLVINYRDITERRLAEEAVKESEKKFRALFDSANDGIFIHRLTGYFLEVNEIACRQLGYTREEMLRLTPGDIDAPEYATKVPERTEELVRNGQAVFETAHLTKDGRVIPIEANSRIVDFGGKPAVLTIARDVTERKKAQEALLASEADYRNLFHQTLLGMEVVDGQTGKVMLANHAIATMFGFNSPEEMVGLDAITGWVLPEDMEWVIREFARVMAEPAKRDVATLRVRGKDGRIVWVSGSGTFFDYEGKPAILISLIDVTAAKEAEHKLRDSEEKNRLLIDNSIEAISVIQDGVIKFANRRFAESVGCSAQELVSRSFADFIHPDDRQRVAEYYFKRMSGEEAPSNYQFRWIDREAADHWGEASVAILNWEGRPATLCMLSDITERVKAEQAVRESESRFRALVQNLQDVILIIDIDGKVVLENPATAVALGESLLGKIAFDVVHPEDVSNAKRAFNDVVNRVNDDSPLHLRMRRADGSWLDMEVLGANLFDDINVRGMLVVCRDVTLRLKAQRELRDSEERFRALIEEATDAVAILEPSGKTVYYSPSMRRVTGYTPEEWAGKSLGDLLIHPDDLVSLASLLEEMKQPNATAEGITVRYVHKDGLWHTLEATVRNMIHDPKIGGIVANFRDVTERVKAEQALKESEERFRGLVETSSDWVWEIDRNSRYTYVSPKVRDILGHEPRELLGHTPFEFMHQREGRRVSKIVRRFADAHLPFSLLENTCIHKDGHSVVLETSAVPILDSDGGFLGYRGIDRDITERKKVEQELQRSLKRLEKTMESTIEAITTTIETRDPYTTGHQMRVTDLACAIAKVMEVPPTQIEGIRVAGLLHDIGKIAIPTEILSKPGKLTEVEFSMIKTHAKTGYNILKKIEFAWPVAKAVLQHHERWNGSGYPHGIRGEDILLEARILAVADVMEAMASHRPYRPSVGLDKALEEVSKNSGILYDPAVAKACETAFARDGFKFVSAVPGVVAESGSTSSDRPVHSPENR